MTLNYRHYLLCFLGLHWLAAAEAEVAVPVQESASEQSSSIHVNHPSRDPNQRM